MPQVTRTATVSAPAEEVWQLVGDFVAVDRWMPDIEAVSIRPAPGDPSKPERIVTTPEGVFVERFLERDPANRSLVYMMPNPPFPITDHRATLTVEPADGNNCLVVWTATFTADDEVVAAVDAAMGTRAFEVGLDALVGRFKRSDQTPPTDADAAPAVAVWDRYPDAAIDEDNVAQYEGFLSHELRLPRCRSCQRWHAPPRSLCPHCWSTDVVPTPVSGRGVVHLSMLLHAGPPAPGVRYPHPVVTVELAEQAALRFTSTLAPAGSAPLPIGTPVALTWIDRGGAPLPAFQKTPSSTTPSSTTTHTTEALR